MHFNQQSASSKISPLIFDALLFPRAQSELFWMQAAKDLHVQDSRLYNLFCDAQQLLLAECMILIIVIFTVLGIYTVL